MTLPCQRKQEKKLDFGNVNLLDKVYHSRATLPHVIKTDYQFKKCNSGLRKDQIVFQEVYKLSQGVVLEC